MSHHRKKDPKSKKRILIFAVPAAVLVIAAATAGAFLLRHGGAQETAAGAGEKTGDQTTGNETTEADLVWNGTAYNYNDHLSNYLFLGIDNREKAETRTGQANAGQADALYLLSWDRMTDDITVITIPRDTMTQIEVFGPGGESLGMTEDHISLSYAYGDGSHESCRLAQDAVSNLLYGLSIQGYCSINMDGLPVLTESVGGVTVTVPNDSLEAVAPEFQEGAQVTLNGENTETFVRYRDTKESQSALARMERQQEYIRAYGEAAKQRFAKDPGFITTLYGELEPYMVTNMGADEFADVMQSLSAGGGSESWTVPGEGTEGKSYDEYHVDDNALYEKIIETFYEEAK